MTVFDFLDVFDGAKDFMVCVVELDTLDVLYNDTYQNWLGDDYDTSDIESVDTRNVFSVELTTMSKGIVIYV